MIVEKLLATLGTVLLFGLGVAASALADGPPTTADPTTSAPTTTTSTSMSTTTSTVTTTPAETSTATVPTTATTTTASAPRAIRRRPLPHGASVSDAPSSTVRTVLPQRKKHWHRVSKPLTVTPPLGRGSHVFPVVGPSGYGDSYGGFRGDVHGKWHHGDDIFAPLGAPVVAVANGTINRVGWHTVGGWRLWVRDAAADEFYYAHLSGYAPSVFHSKHVTAGEVIGFVGNTGDAFTGPTHLHFEVHPHQLLRLRYDGAVDPTTYLEGWPHVRNVAAPVPVHPRLPRQPSLRSEALRVFRQLLVARHLIEQPPNPSEQPEIDRPSVSAASPPQLLPMREEPVLQTVAEGSSVLTIALFVGLGSVAFFAATAVLASMGLGRLWR